MKILVNSAFLTLFAISEDTHALHLTRGGVRTSVNFLYISFTVRIFSLFSSPQLKRNINKDTCVEGRNSLLREE